MAIAAAAGQLPGARRHRVAVRSGAARWTVEVTRDGAPVGSAAGESLPGDARFSKGPGSGIQALAFDVPAS